MAARTIEDDPRWAQVVARDKTADGLFFYSVATTGVFCKPSCASRPANPKNIRFHATVAACEAAGFRACKRCNPGATARDTRIADTVALACRLIDVAESPPSLAAMAEVVGLSPHHFHRIFKAATGVTPARYAAARRAEKLREGLATGGTVTAAIHAAGFNAANRFYDVSNTLLGMTPTAYRAGGADTDIRFAVARCSLGSILVARSPKGVCAISLGDAPEPLVRALRDRFPKANLIGADDAFETVVSRVVTFVENPGPNLDLPLDVRGTAFQCRVWQALLAIPPGATVSYADLARGLGAPSAARAVAGACAANTLAVAIPCHRVVRGDGSLSGYRWGVDRKQALLDREKDRLDREKDRLDREKDRLDREKDRLDRERARPDREKERG